MTTLDFLTRREIWRMGEDQQEWDSIKVFEICSNYKDPVTEKYREMHHNLMANTRNCRPGKL